MKLSKKLQNVKLPDIIIVGSGPLGENVARGLNTQIICCVNQAIELPKKCDYWFISDCSLANTDWFKRACLRYRNANRIFHQGLSNYTDLWFTTDEDCEKATVLGSALKVFYLLGVKNITLIGFDFEGVSNYNGPGIRTKGNLEQKARKCEMLIKKFNLNVKSLTPTRLNL